MSVSERMIKGAKLYKKKNADYGNSWIKTGELLQIIFPSGLVIKGKCEFTILALLIRKLDKLCRISELSLGKSKQKIRDEEPSNTADDDGVYAFMLAEYLSKYKKEDGV